MTYFVGGEDGSRKSVTELPVKNGRPPTPSNVVLPTQSVITWYRPSERMPEFGHLVLVAVNGDIYKARRYRSHWLLDTKQKMERTPEWWAELPTVPGGEA